jgi:hypothetical protein
MSSLFVHTLCKKTKTVLGLIELVGWSEVARMLLARDCQVLRYNGNPGCVMANVRLDHQPTHNPLLYYPCIYDVLFGDAHDHG